MPRREPIDGEGREGEEPLRAGGHPQRVDPPSATRLAESGRCGKWLVGRSLPYPGRELLDDSSSAAARSGGSIVQFRCGLSSRFPAWRAQEPGS